MKKIMSLVLALTLVLSMGVTVFAAESTNPTTVKSEDIDNNNTNIEVTAGYTAPTHTSAGEAYHVVISWEKGGNLSYTDATYEYTWKPESGANGAYTKAEKTPAKWNFDGAYVKITVTNKSNADITATCGDITGKNGVTVTGAYGTEGKTLELESAAPKTITDLNGHEVTKSTTCTINNVSGAISQNDIVVATISVTISAN